MCELVRTLRVLAVGVELLDFLQFLLGSLVNVAGGHHADSSEQTQASALHKVSACAGHISLEKLFRAAKGIADHAEATDIGGHCERDDADYSSDDESLLLGLVDLSLLIGVRGVIVTHNGNLHKVNFERRKRSNDLT